MDTPFPLDKVISYLNSSSSFPVSELYYYRNSCHKQVLSCYSGFKDYYIFLFHAYRIDCSDASVVTDKEVDECISKEFSYKQRIYLSQFEDGTFRELIRHHRICQKMAKLCENRDFELMECQDKEGVVSCARHVIILSEKFDGALSEIENRSSILYDLLFGIVRYMNSFNRLSYQ
jgi:hypothetical protein